MLSNSSENMQKSLCARNIACKPLTLWWSCIRKAMILSQKSLHGLRNIYCIVNGFTLPCFYITLIILFILLALLCQYIAMLIGHKTL